MWDTEIKPFLCLQPLSSQCLPYILEGNQQQWLHHGDGTTATISLNTGFLSHLTPVRRRFCCFHMIMKPRNRKMN